MKRTYKHRLYLNNKTKATIEETLKLCCWLYNYLLEQFREREKNKQKQLTERQLQNLLPKLKEDYLFLKQVQANALQDVAKRVHKTWQRYLKLKTLDFKKKYPKFKPVHRYNSFTYTQPIVKRSCGYKLDNSLLTKKKETRKLRLSFGKQNVRYNQAILNIIITRDIQGEIKTLTIKQKNERYYALFSCDNIPAKLLPETNQSIGVDVNLNKSSYIALSNGKKYKQPQYYKKAEKELKEANRSLSSKVKKSQNWKDVKLQLAKKWEKVVNQSKHETYQIVNDLVKNYDGIAIEKLDIRNMLKNKSLAKSIQQARWGILFKVLAEAAEIATRQLVRVNPRNTTQICSECGELVKEKLDLRQRIFKCFSCKFELDRDINSARNILNRAKFRSDRDLPL